MRQIQSAIFEQLSKLVLADLISTAQEIELFEWASRIVQKYRLDTLPGQQSNPSSYANGVSALNWR